MTKVEYMTAIANTDELTALNDLVEMAAFDIESNADYEEIYNAAMNKVRKGN